MAETYRMTSQRQVILDELKKTTAHPTADQLYDKVREKMPKISLGTVYRNLEVLTEMGKIARLDYGGGQRRYDGNPYIHTHIKCRVCGRVEDLPGDMVSDARATGERPLGYRDVKVMTVFVGTCPDCHKAGKG